MNYVNYLEELRLQQMFVQDIAEWEELQEMIEQLEAEA